MKDNKLQYMYHGEILGQLRSTHWLFKYIMANVIWTTWSSLIIHLDISICMKIITYFSKYMLWRGICVASEKQTDGDISVYDNNVYLLQIHWNISYYLCNCILNKSKFYSSAGYVAHLPNPSILVKSDIVKCFGYTGCARLIRTGLIRSST